MYDREALELLRENTCIGVFSKIRLYKRKKSIDNFCKLYRNGFFDHDYDYSIYYEGLNILEYELRLRQWTNHCRRAWEKYICVEDDRIGLEDFADRALKLKRVKE